MESYIWLSMFWKVSRKGRKVALSPRAICRNESTLL